MNNNIVTPITYPIISNLVDLRFRILSIYLIVNIMTYHGIFSLFLNIRSGTQETILKRTLLKVASSSPLKFEGIPEFHLPVKQ